MIEKYENRNTRETKKGSLKIKKDNTIKSLKEVEYFVGNWKKALKGIKLYKLLK